MRDLVEHYRQQREIALQQAEGGSVDRDGWLRIAEEWRKLLDAASRMAEEPKDTRNG